MFYLMHDTPESEGLPPVDEWKGEKVVQKVESARTLSSKDIFMKYILNNKFLWPIAIANVFVYFVRYGIIDLYRNRVNRIIRLFARFRQCGLCDG